MSLLRRLSRLATLTAATALGLALTTASSTAAPSFYDPPRPLPAGENGDVIRHEPSSFHLDPLRGVEAPADVERIMYRSTDARGEPTAVTGTVLTPQRSWDGPGQRPLIAFAPGTQGIGDQCAPSKRLASGEEYEGVMLKALLNQGYGVVVTDYEGLGTPGVHTYVTRESMGHAVLDAARAAQRLPAADLPDSGPVATYGYSQGGGGSAAAAELQPNYAPELDLRGSYAGAVPADLRQVAAALDGNVSAGLLGFALVGADSAYPEAGIPDILNERGKEMAQQIREDCVTDIPHYAFTRSEDLTADGRSVLDHLDEEPFRSIVDEQTIGDRAPEVPVLSVHSIADDIVPYQQGREMARKWCRQGAQVQFSSYAAPTHVAPAVLGIPEALHFLEQRFAGREAPSNCAELLGESTADAVERHAQEESN
ncbi:lipase family protein [Salinifilum aidingensis]